MVADARPYLVIHIHHMPWIVVVRTFHRLGVHRLGCRIVHCEPLIAYRMRVELMPDSTRKWQLQCAL